MTVAHDNALEPKKLEANRAAGDQDAHQPYRRYESRTTRRPID